MTCGTLRQTLHSAVTTSWRSRRSCHLKHTKPPPLAGAVLQHLFPQSLGLSAYLAIFLVVAVENLGVPFPGETALLAGAALASQGKLAIIGVILSAAAGAIAGSACGYAIGFAGGAPAIERYGARFGLTQERLHRMNDFFSRHGTKAVFFGRFIAILRTWAALLAGTARMPLAPFMIYTTLGAVVWAGLFGALGYVFGRSLPALEHDITLATLCLLGAVIVFGGIYLIGHRALRSRSTPTGSSTGNR